jgi:long-chain fatty acid transport protein
MLDDRREVDPILCPRLISFSDLNAVDERIDVPDGANKTKGLERTMIQGFKLALGAASGLVLALGVSGAKAGGFAVREQSAEALGESFAGVGAGAGGLSSMFWNPATMTQHEGWNSSWSFTGILPYANITPSSATVATIGGLTGGLGSTGGSGNIGRSALLPAAYMTYQVNNWLWVGYSQNAPYGLVNKSNYDWAGQVYGRTSEVRSYDFQPTVAIKLNDMISIGFGVQIERFSTRLTAAGASSVNPLSALAVGSPTGALTGHDWALGFTTGITFTPFQGTQLGVGYRSQISEHLTGSLLVPPLPVSFGIRSNITLPDELTIGLRQRITNDVTMLAGFEWTHWSLFNRFPVFVTTQPSVLFPPIGSPVTTLAFRYNDGWFGSLGGEYKWNSNLTLRAGVALEKSPISTSVRNVRIPDSDRLWTSLGASYRYNEKLSFDLSYAHLFMRSAPIAILNAANPAFGPPPGLPFAANTKAHVDIVSVGINYRWDNPKIIADAPQAAVQK